VVSPSAFESLLGGGAEIAFPDWGLVAVEGRHRERFLNSQLASDVVGLAEGASQQFALLDRSGRLQAFGFLLKRADRIELLLPEELAAPAIDRMASFVVAEDVSFRRLETAPLRLALGAEALRRVGELPSDQVFPLDAFASRGFVTWNDADLGLQGLLPEELEVLRVLSGLPRWGVEVGPDRLIHESTLLEAAVSFDKGCYLGQETVAKVHSGRGPAVAAMLLEMEDTGLDLEELVGQTFAADGRDRAGEVRSQARWQGRSFLQVALARELRVEGRVLECRFANGTVSTGRVRGLPLLRAPEPEAWARDLNLRAVDAFTADHEEEAMVLLERAIAVCPAYADAYESLGVILGRHRRYEEAISLMQRLLEIDQGSVMAHTNLSVYYNQLGRIEDAEREAGEAARAGAERARIARTGAETSRQRESDREADRLRRAEVFRQVLELDADDALANFGLGELLLEQERYAEAIGHLDRAVAGNPRQSAAYLALGMAHEETGGREAAFEVFRKGVEVAAAQGDLMVAKKIQERLAEGGSLSK